MRESSAEPVGEAAPSGTGRGVTLSAEATVVDSGHDGSSSLLPTGGDAAKWEQWRERKAKLKEKRKQLGAAEGRPRLQRRWSAGPDVMWTLDDIFEMNTVVRYWVIGPEDEGALLPPRGPQFGAGSSSRLLGDP